MVHQGLNAPPMCTARTTCSARPCNQCCKQASSAQAPPILPTLYGGGQPGRLINGESTAAAAAAAAAVAAADPLASFCCSSGECAKVRTISAMTRRRPSADLRFGGGGCEGKGGLLSVEGEG